MVSALNRTVFRLFWILIIRSPKCHLQPTFRLEVTIQTVAIVESDHWRMVQV